MAVEAAAATDVLSYLLAALGAEGLAISGLFALLIQAKNETSAAYKEILPAATLLMQTVQSLQKLLEKLESKQGA